MLEKIAEFLHWGLDRDRSKWYTFSIFDLVLMFYSGVQHYMTDGADSCITLWVVIIALNAIQSYFHNKKG